MTAVAALAASVVRRDSCELVSGSPLARADSARDLCCHATHVDGLSTCMGTEESPLAAIAATPHLRVEALRTGWNGRNPARHLDDCRPVSFCAETVLQ